MAIRKPFKNDPVGRARQNLKAKQIDHNQLDSRTSERALAEAEKELNFEINLRKRRKQKGVKL